MNKSNILSTKDLKENDNFNKYYSEWWDERGPFEPLHIFNRLRINYILRQLPQSKTSNNYKILRDLRVLDVGCGGGILCEPLARLGANVTGIDTSDNAIRIAKYHSKRNKIKVNYLHSDIVDLKKTEKFDIILCMEVLEHVKNIELLIRNISFRLNMNGRIIGSTINRTASSYFFAIFIAERILKLLPAETHNWNKFVSTDELEYFLLKENFKNINFTGSTYNPIKKNWKYIESKKVNYFFAGFKE